MEETLQHEATTQCAGLSPTSPRNHRSNGSQAGHALTFNLDHSMGADHRSREKMEKAMEKGETCIECHKGIAHKLPEGMEDDD